MFIREQKKCIEICGDGQNFGTYQCDDGNILDGDGCSKTCQVEQDFDCKKVDGTDTCFYVGVVNIVKAKAYKYPFSNNLLIQCKLDPIKNFFYTIDWKAGIMLIGPKMEVLDSWMEGEWLNINTTYFEDLSGKTLTIKYSTSLAKNKTVRSTARSLFESVFDFDITLRDYELPIVPANNIKPTYLEEDTYETVKEVQQALFTTATCVIVMILAAFALKTVFPFWQLVFSLQAIFLSLGVINYMNPLLTGLTEFSVVKGLRSTKIYFESLVSPNTAIEYNIASLGYVSSFFGNMNIMMFIWIALILTSGALFLMSKKDLAMGFPFQFCKRSLMLLVLFSSMGYAFSVGLITSNYPFELLVATICGVITVVQIYNLLKHMKLYFHFDRTFDLANRKIKYVVAMIIFTRIGQALVISLFRTNTFIAACITLAAQVLLTVGFIVFRPYTRPLFNLLNIVGELAVTGFMAINLVLNLELIHEIDVEIILSYGQISLNFLVVLLMLGCFVYSIVVDFCIKDKHLTPLKFDDLEVDKIKPFNAYKNSSSVSKKQYNLKIEDFQDEDQSDVAINYRDNRLLIVSK
jgi:cysteine-rich repeat protein